MKKLALALVFLGFAGGAHAQIAKPTLSAPGGAPGTRITVSMANLAIADSVEIGFGTFAEHQILAQGQVDKTGAFKGTVAIPDDAVQGPHYFFVGHANGSPMGVSEAFLVTRADGTVRVRGQVTQATAECTVVKGLQDEAYALVGQFAKPAAGAKVSVEGTLAKTPACRQALTLQVKSVTVDR